MSQERSFGMLLCAIAVLPAWQAWRTGATPTPWLSLSFSLALIAIVRPRLLGPITRAWLALGEVLHRVISPMVLGILFFGIISPIAAVMRFAGRDALRRKLDPEESSYWTVRHPPGPEA